MLKHLAPDIQWKLANGWAREHAEAYTLISGCLAAPLAAAVRERSPRYAASTHALCAALAEQSTRLAAPAPPLYKNLTGEFGLATDDPAWAALLQPGASAGLSFVTDGFRVSIDFVYKLQDSDVVCFQSAPADADGY